MILPELSLFVESLRLQHVNVLLFLKKVLDVGVECQTDSWKVNYSDP